jgi:Protein of unknown function (DUF1571)
VAAGGALGCTAGCLPETETWLSPKVLSDMQITLLRISLLGVILALICFGCSNSEWPRRAHAESPGQPDAASVEAGASAESGEDVSPDSALARLDDRTLLELAEDDPLALLMAARSHYERNIYSYRCTLIKRERGDDGTLGAEETIACRWLRAPFSVFLKWDDGAGRIDKALYAPAILGSQVAVHPTGLAGLFASSVKIDLDGEHAEDLKQITGFGFRSVFDLLIERGGEAHKQGDLTSSFLGQATVGTQAALVFQWLLPAGRGYPCGRILVHLSAETLLPLEVAMWDWDEQLKARYEYRDLQTNVALTARDFTEVACGLKN